MNLLVTGAAGFIGSCYVRTLPASDASDALRVTVLDAVGTQTLAALRHRVEPFVHLSTDEVHGPVDSGSWPEDRPLPPNSPDSASEAPSDLLALAYHRTHGLDVGVTRCSDNHGPHQSPEKVIPLSVTNLLDGRRVPLHGEGLDVRDWLHVEDHCQGVDPVRTKGRPGEVCNVGGGAELSNKELTGLLLEACGADRDRVEHVDDRKGHALRHSVDWSKAREELGHRPRRDFTTGLADTVARYREDRAWWAPLQRRSA